MKRPKLAPDTYSRRTECEGALHYLKLARDCLIAANAPQALAKVRRAIRSTDGAIRNAHGRFTRDRWQNEIASKQAERLERSQ